MSKSKSRVERATEEPKIDTSMYPETVGRPGERVELTGGDIPDMDGTTTVDHAAGKQARIDGVPYIAEGGPNKGKVIQPVRVEGSGDILGVPADQIRRRGGEKSRGNHAMPRISSERWDSIFGKRKK